MPKPNNDLVSTKITRSTKQQLQFVKAQYLFEKSPLAISDYNALAHLVQQEYDRVVQMMMEKNKKERRG